MGADAAEFNKADTKLTGAGCISDDGKFSVDGCESLKEMLSVNRSRLHPALPDQENPIVFVSAAYRRAKMHGARYARWPSFILAGDLPGRPCSKSPLIKDFGRLTVANY